MRRYLAGMHDRFGQLATWLPNESLKLGDIGEIRGSRFYQRTSLGQLGIPFDVREGSPADLSHSSGEDVAIDFGATAGGDAAKVTLRFGKTGAYMFQARACRIASIADTRAVADELVFAYRRGDVADGVVVVDRLVHAESATILISTSQSAMLELGATHPIRDASTLADATIGLHVRSAAGAFTQVVASRALTPLFGASRLRIGWLKRDRLEAVRSDTAAAADSARAAIGGPLVDVSLDEWLGCSEDGAAS